MFFVQYVPACACGGRGPLITEQYHNINIAREAFRSLAAICWAELVGPDGSVLDYREGTVRMEVEG